MILNSLLIRNFRMIQETRLPLSPGMQLFLGQNAQGKTSLIEAVLFLSTSTSHRTHKEEELIRWEEQAAYLRGEIRTEMEQETLECGLEKQRKIIKINERALPRVGDLYGHLRTVLFAPEDLMIVSGSPQLRRRFLDMAIAQLEPAYIPLLQQFHRALRQRNQILKRLQASRTPAGETQLDVWDQPFLQYAVDVMIRRAETVSRLAPMVQEYYAGLADDGPLELLYPSAPENRDEAIREKLREKQKRLRPSEIENGSSRFGPQRDDLLLHLAGRNLSQFGSQGQRRTAALALRLAESRLCHEQMGQWPLLLIDDVVHEMDNNRRARFWRHIDPSGQMIVTATDREHLGAGEQPACIFKVEHGSISPL